MYILTTVFALLVLMSIYITTLYTRLYDGILENKIVQNYIKEYESHISKVLYTKAQTRWNSLNRAENQGNRTERLSRFLHISNALKKTESEKGKLAQVALEELLYYLYKDQEFFKEAVGTNDSKKEIHKFVDTLIKIYNEKSDDGQAFIDPGSLANLNLEDYDGLFREMVKNGTASIEDRKEGRGYPKFFDYISFQKKTALACPYLAPRAILMVLFDDDEIVENVIKTRKDYYTQIHNAKKADRKKLIEDLSTQFAETFESQLKHGFTKEEIKFKVSGTNPDD